MSDEPSCRDCALAKWQLSPTGQIRKAAFGTCQWDSVAFFARISAEIPKAVAGEYQAVTARHFEPSVIWWDKPMINCPAHVKEPS